MPYGFKTFGDGTLPTTKSTLMTLQANHSAALSVKLTNLASVSISGINVYVNANGTSRRIFPKDLTLDAGDWIPSGVEELEEGDTIEGSAPVVGMVEYRISGLDRE